MFIWVKIFKTIEIQLVRLTKVRGKVLSEENDYNAVKTALFLSNVIEADHQNSCLFTNNFMSNTLPIAPTRLLENIFQPLIQFEKD